MVTGDNAMRGFHFDLAWLGNGWETDINIEVDASGIIRSVEKSTSKTEFQSVKGAVLPGMPNLHSHAFQRAMAGLAEKRSSASDSFWSWRKVMYGFLDLLEPEDVTAITAQLYVELLRGGYTSVAEFHYLHHDRNGAAYENPSCMADAVLEGARQAGMPVTMLPVFYAHSGFGGKTPEAGQRRFINSLESYHEIFSALNEAKAEHPHLTVGMAPHSLRAATREEIQAMREMASDVPFHIHIAEQQKEVSDCEAFSGARPVDWLYDNLDVDDRWCLVHATHVSSSEVSKMAKSGAVVGLCPLTEANLGDGIFPVRPYKDQDGYFGIGSDSNIAMSVARELECLEYGQRLQSQERNVLATEECPNVGNFLYTSSLTGGARALGQPIGALKVGSRADFVVLDTERPDFYGRSSENILDIYLFSATENAISEVFIAGNAVVQNGQHVKQEKIAAVYKRRMKDLLSRLQ
jgi:formimidoylglutamate deiminase